MMRRERRAERQRQHLMKRARPWTSLDQEASAKKGARGQTDYEAPLPWWLRPLDYKVSGESGALRVPNRMRVRPRSEGRNGPTYVVKARSLGSLAKPMTHGEWRKLVAKVAPVSTTG